MQVDPRASAPLWAPHDSSPLALLPHRCPQLVTQYQEPATTHLCEPQAPGFAILLAPGVFPPYRAWRPSLPTVPDSKRALAVPSKSEIARFPIKGRKAVTCYSAGSTKGPVPPRYTEAQCFMLHSLQKSLISPVQSLESQLLYWVELLLYLLLYPLLWWC
jgi:hypothetical protein